jgi:predicted Zn-dependent protease
MLMRHLKIWSALLAAVALLAGGCSKQSTAKRHLEQGQKYLAAGEYDKAEIEFQNVMRVSHTNVAAVRALGQMYFEGENLMPSLAFLNTAKKLDPNDVQSRARVSRVYLTAGAVKEAREEAAFVLDRSPTNEIAMLTYVDSFAQTNDVRTPQQKIEQLRQKAGGI